LVVNQIGVQHCCLSSEIYSVVLLQLHAFQHSALLQLTCNKR